MDFFQKHDRALRKGRLLQAAATLLAGQKSIWPDPTVRKQVIAMVFLLEECIEDKLKEEKNGR